MIDIPPEKIILIHMNPEAQVVLRSIDAKALLTKMSSINAKIGQFVYGCNSNRLIKFQGLFVIWYFLRW